MLKSVCCSKQMGSCNCLVHSGHTIGTFSGHRHHNTIISSSGRSSCMHPQNCVMASNGGKTSTASTSTPVSLSGSGRSTQFSAENAETVMARLTKSQIENLRVVFAEVAIVDLRDLRLNKPKTRQNKVIIMQLSPEGHIYLPELVECLDHQELILHTIDWIAPGGFGGDYTERTWLPGTCISVQATEKCPHSLTAGQESCLKAAVVALSIEVFASTVGPAISQVISELIQKS